MRSRARLLCLPAVGLLLAACSSSSPGPSPTSLLHAGGEALGRLQTVAAEIKVTKGDLELQGYKVTSASTRIRLPSDSDSTVHVKQGDLRVELRLVTLSGRSWVKLPFFGFNELTPAQAQELPNIARVFDPAQGMPAVLDQARSPKLLAPEKVEGVDCDRVDGAYTADQLGQMFGFKPTGDVKASLWLGRADHLTRKVVLSGVFSSAGQTAGVEIRLRDFNAPVDIQDPSRVPA
jgi:hypothetical protein